MAQKLPLNYANIDYDDVISKVNSQLITDGFSDIVDAKSMESLIEIFGGSVDMIIYYIERRAEEGFMGTAQLKSSVILKSRDLGYVVRRPTPASMRMNITINGSSALTGIPAWNGETITFQRYSTTFTFKGKPYVLKKTYFYDVSPSDGLTTDSWSKVFVGAVLDGDRPMLKTQSEIDALPTGTSWEYIEALQGEFRTFILTSSENPQSGDIFQKYKLPDSEFSDLFGINDPSYDANLGVQDLSTAMTQVSVVSNGEEPFSDATLYTIDRRSLINHETLYRDTWDVFYDANGNLIEANVPRVVLIRTEQDGTVGVKFADGLIARYPQVDQDIHIKYFATKGVSANEVGVVGQKVPSNSKFYLQISGIVDITNLVSFESASNVLGGGDLESIESIRLNAPAVYNSLDRLISKGDYVSYLLNQVSPLKTKNAIVWGEQEEALKDGVRAISRYSNMVLYSIIGNLYTLENDGSYTPKHFSTGVGDEVNTFEADSFLERFDYNLYSPQSYFNILIADNPVLMKTYENELYKNFFLRTIGDYTQFQVDMMADYPLGHPISQMNSKLDARGQLTTKPQYITPILQMFDISGEVVLRDFADMSVVQPRVESAIYEYLDTNINYNSPIYRSVIVDIVKSDPDVMYTNLEFSPVASSGSVITDWENEPEFQSQIPYTFTGLFVNQSQIQSDRFLVTPQSGFLDNGSLYSTEGRMNLLGQTLKFSQDGGTTEFWAEISDVIATSILTADFNVLTKVQNMSEITEYTKGYLVIAGGDIDVANIDKIALKILNKTLTPTGEYIYDTSYIYITPQDGESIWVEDINQYLQYNVGGGWFSIPQPNPDFWIKIKSESAIDVSIPTLSADVVTNMDAICADLGFSPKNYLVEGFVEILKKEVKRLFEVIIAKKCDTCPTEPISQDVVAIVDTCRPLGISNAISNPVNESQGCYDSTATITWNDYYKSLHREQYESWTRCNELSLLTQDDFYDGKYNSELDISEFGSVVLPQYPWKLNAPERGDLGNGWVTEINLHHRVGGITERWFYGTLMRGVMVELRRIANKKAGTITPDFYTSDRTILDMFLQEFGEDGSGFVLNNISSQVTELLNRNVYIEDVKAVENVEKFIASAGFRGLMFKLHNGVTKAIRSGMLDKDGNIVNYSLDNEIVQLTSRLNFRYRS